MNTEAKVGAFVVLSMAVLLATIYHVSSEQLRGARVSYKTYFRYAGGLEPGADVLFGGIKVGTVTSVRPDAQDPTRIQILLDVKPGTPLNGKSLARLGSVTVVTSPVISISTGSNDAPRLPPGAVIPSAETVSLDETERKIVTLADSAQTLLTSVNTDVNSLTQDARVLIAHLNQITGEANQTHLAETLASADTMITRLSPKVAQISDQVQRLTENANGVMAKAGSTVDNANNTVTNANDTITKLREPMQADLEEMRKTLEEARGLIATLRSATSAKDQDLTETLENVRITSDNLSQLTESLKERPWSLVRIKQPKDRKVPQTARTQ